MLSGGLDARGVTSSPWADVDGAPGLPLAGAGDHAEELAPNPIDWWAVGGLGVLLAAGGLWLRSLGAVEPREMTELGLLTVLPPTFVVAAALLTAGFVLLLTRPVRSGPLLGAYVATFAVLAHTTQVAVSGALGNAWAWANTGVADHVLGTGDLPMATGPRAATTDWPGAATFTALLADVSGIAPATLAAWFPLAATLIALLALRVIGKSVSADDGLGWAAMWLFVLGSWVGHAHLSPAGWGAALGLALLAVALPLDRRHDPHSVLAGDPVVAAESVGALAAAVCFIVVAAFAIVATDPVTTLIVAATCALAAATRTSRTLWLAALLIVAGGAWLVGPARSAIDGDPLAWLQVGGAPAQFASLASRPLAALTGETQVVVIAGRFLALALVVLAVAGLALRARQGRPLAFIGGALLAPLVLLVAGSGSETLLRAFLHALPWVALAGAFALVAGAPGSAGSALRLGVVGALTAGFVVAQSGERGAGLFTAAEVELVSWVEEAAPDVSLVIAGSLDVPLGGGDVERAALVSLADEPPGSIEALAADPEGALHARLAAAPADGFAGAYVLITRSQRHAESIAPRLPAGLLTTIETELRGSPRFIVVGENADGVVFALRPGAAS